MNNGMEISHAGGKSKGIFFKEKQNQDHKGGKGKSNVAIGPASKAAKDTTIFSFHAGSSSGPRGQKFGHSPLKGSPSLANNGAPVAKDLIKDVRPSSFLVEREIDKTMDLTSQKDKSHAVMKDDLDQMDVSNFEHHIDPPEKSLLGCESKKGVASLLALVSASIFLGDPALAFKGGGPYGAEVTRGQDLTGKDFSGKTLIKQDFNTSILRQANIKGAKLLGASFFDADLTGADLSDADFRGADLSLANVTKANLSNANLEGAPATGNTSFKGSNITGADFTDVPLRDDQHEYLCKVADG
ncbi:hypothetical protein REPUB_Repub13aG0083800 [Reevesia pubescens]